MRSPFGVLLVDPASLTFRERVDCLRRLQGQYAAASDRESQWLARALLGILQGESDDLLGLLDLRPQRGCKLTVARVVAQEMRDVLLVSGQIAAPRSTVKRARRRRRALTHTR